MLCPVGLSPPLGTFLMCWAMAQPRGAVLAQGKRPWQGRDPETHPRLSGLKLILLEIFQVLLFIPSFIWVLSEMPRALQDIPAELTTPCSVKALIHPALSIFSPSLSLSLFHFFFFSHGH